MGELKEIENGKNYYSLNNGTICIDRVDAPNNVGFRRGLFVNDITCSSSSNWREATNEEVVEAFEKECIRRYGDDWENVKLKHEEVERVVSSDLNKGLDRITINKLFGSWVIYNKNGILYYNGVWNDALEKEENACINHEPLEEGVQLQTDDAKPEYYKQNDPFKIMEDNCTEEEIMGAIKLNILKYTLRNKGQDESDFHKIKGYADWGLRILKKRKK